MKTNHLTLINDDGKNIVFSRICPFCCKEHQMSFSSKEYHEGSKRYSNEKCMIQDAFPSFTPSQREFLMTGICDDCWNNI